MAENTDFGNIAQLKDDSDGRNDNEEDQSRRD